MTLHQLLSFHVLFLLFALLAVLITDACGLVYLIGLRQRMNGICLRIKHGLIASACAATVGTGLLLVIMKPEVMAQSAFWMKMVFVAALCVNGWLIGRKIPLLTSGPFKALGRRARWTLGFGAMASLNLIRVPHSEAWISDQKHLYRVTLPAYGSFEAWLARYSASGDTGPITIGMDLGAVISEIGLPSKVGHGVGCRGYILRYTPGAVDFHFLGDGKLFLVYDDDQNAPPLLGGSST